MKIESGALTGNVLRDDILVTTACSVRADKQILFVFSDSEAYIYKTLADMRRKKLILYNPNSDVQLALTGEAVRELKEIAPELYEFYMQYSNNNHPGLTEAHKSGYKRVSEIIACMRKAGVLVGPEKPSVANIYAGVENRLSLIEHGASFYLNKELRGSDGVKENRSTISRSSGALFSKGVSALVYNCGNNAMKFGRVAEKSACSRLVHHMKSIYKDLPAHEPKYSIVFCDSDDIALQIFGVTNPSETAKTNYFGDAVRSTKVLNTDVIYLPATAAGATSLRWLVEFGPEKMLDACFTAEERHKAMQLGFGDAVIKDLVCYEFVSCNLSKLEKAKRKRKEGAKVGIVCAKSQLHFVVEYIGPPEPLPVRALPETDIQTKLERGG